MRFSILTLITLSLIIFSSCSNKQYQVLFEKRNSIPDSNYQQQPVTLSNYKIKSQDLLQIRNLQNVQYIVDQAPSATSNSGNSSNQGQTYQVEEDGTVALPVIGHIKISGLTRTEAQNFIEGQYKKSLLKDPIIELKIVNLKVTLLGEVKAPGNYPLIKDKTTLIELIGEAGGITDKANERNIEIIRGSEQNPHVTIIDLNDIHSINDPHAILQSGDIIYIAQNKRAVRNDNLSNFSVIIQPALILFNTALIIFTLVRK